MIAAGGAVAATRRGPYAAGVSAAPADRHRPLPVRLGAPEAGLLARRWHLGTALAAGAALLLQLVVTLTTGQQPPGVRLVRFASYFTTDANALVLVSAAMLARDERREGLLWRALRLYGLVALVASALVYAVVVRPVADLTRWALVADLGLHVVVPLLAAVGWVVFGPRGWISARELPATFGWLSAWFGWTLVHGAATRFYPYPFLDVVDRGYLAVVGNCAVVTLVLGCVTLAAWGLDRRLDDARR